MAEVLGRWGWHKLDSRWIDRLITAVDVRPGDRVLDVGAGTGAITERLLERGASVVAIELHPRRAALLRARFDGRDVIVVRTDAADLRLPRRPFKVVANPPFGITTALLRRLTNPRSALQSAAIVVPSWAATCWASGHGVGGLTSKRIFSYARGSRVPANAFRPAPPSDAAVLLIRRR